jgi:hypothetical protein
MHYAPIALIGRTDPALRHTAMSHTEPDRYESARTAEVVEVINRCRLIETAKAQRTFWRRPGSGLAPGFYVVASSRTPHRTAVQLGDDAVCQGPFSRRQDADAALREAGLNPGGDEGQEDWRARLQRLLEVTRRHFAATLAGFEHRAVAPDDAPSDARANGRARRLVLSGGRRDAEPIRVGKSILRGAGRARRSNG